MIDHERKLIFAWIGVHLLFVRWRYIKSAVNHRFAARTGYGCTCGMEYEAAMRLLRRREPCPNRAWHRDSATLYRRDWAGLLRHMKSTETIPTQVLRPEVELEWLLAGGPPWLALREPRALVTP